MKKDKDKNINITTVIAGIISLPISFVIFTQNENISDQKLKLLIDMMLIFCVVFIIVTAINYIVVKVKTRNKQKGKSLRK